MLQHYVVGLDKRMKGEYKEVRTGRDGLPVPVAPELFVEIGAVTVVVSK